MPLNGPGVQTIYVVMKRQRWTIASAVIVGLTLVLTGHAPVLPVVAGCFLAVLLAVLRSWPRGSTDDKIREGQ